MSSRGLHTLYTEQFSQLIDFMITTHPAYGELVKQATEQKKNIHQGISTSNRFTEILHSMIHSIE
jgi:hypothetical protein